MEYMRYAQVMNYAVNAPFDKNKCTKCGGKGIVPTGCCNGNECGCLGLAVDVTNCDNCGSPEPTEKQIIEYSKGVK